MGLSGIKSDARLALHEAMGEPCIYRDNDDPEVPSAEQIEAGLVLTARFHTKAKLLATESDALRLMENIEKLVFSQPQLDALGIELVTGAEIEFPGYSLTCVLDQELDPDGPHNRYWTVTRA